MTLAVVPRLPLGIGPPVTQAFPLTQPPVSQGGIDLTTATGVTFRVFRPDGTEVTGGWPGTIASGSTATAATVVHAWATSDLTMVGVWHVAPVVAVPGGSITFDAERIEAVRIPGGP